MKIPPTLRVHATLTILFLGVLASVQVQGGLDTTSAYDMGEIDIDFELQMQSTLARSFMGCIVPPQLRIHWSADESLSEVFAILHKPDGTPVRSVRSPVPGTGSLT